MKTRPFLFVLSLSLGLIFAAGLWLLIGRAAPGNPTLQPSRNSHTAPPTTTVSITYDEPISAATVSSHTFAIHAMQSGLVTVTHKVDGGTIAVTPTMPFHQGELVYAIATTRTLNITGTAPLSATQWQFRAGVVVSRSFGGFTPISTGVTNVAGSVAWGDYDRDGDLDVLFSGVDAVTNTAKVYRNDGGGTFTDISAGLVGAAGSAAWGDYDNDGDLDILYAGKQGVVAQYYLGITKLYRNDGGGTFTDISAGLADVNSSAVAWGDYDNDGDLDILLTGFDDIPWNKVTKLYRNNGNGTFSEVAAGLTAVGNGSAAWGDYDNDGDLDILLAGANTSNNPVTRLYRNNGNGTFSSIAAGLLNVEFSSVAWGDYDNDGYLDILLAGRGAGTAVYNTKLYRNNGDGTFSEVSAGLIAISSGSVAWGDYDNDGDLDILLSGQSALGRIARVYRNDGSGTFTDISAGLVGVYKQYASSVAWGDCDNDYDLDILLSGLAESDQRTFELYRNDDLSSTDRFVYLPLVLRNAP